MLLVHTTCGVDDTSCGIFACLEPLLDPCAPVVHYLCRRQCSWCNLRTPRVFTQPMFSWVRNDLYRRCCSWCTLRMPRAFTQSVCSWRALPVPPMLQLLQSPNATGLYSAQVPLVDTNSAAGVAAGAVSARLEYLLDPGSSGRHYLCRRYCSWCSLRTPRTFT